MNRVGTVVPSTTPVVRCCDTDDESFSTARSAPSASSVPAHFVVLDSTPSDRLISLS
jgi:hypothetical protein